MSYFLAPSLVTLRDEVNRRFPKRDKSSDGWIGDPSHAARVSSHNPLWSAPGKWSGVVRAIDIDIDDNDPSADVRQMVIKAAVGDPRVWYVISNGIIYSSTYGWAARRYTGSNGHYGHVHVSLKETTAAWSDTSKWFDNAPEYKVKAGPVDVTELVAQFKIAAGVESGKIKQSNSVARVQLALNRQIKAGLTVDGYCGKATLNAWGKWEKRHGGSGRPRVPDPKSLTALAKGRFALTNPNWLLKKESAAKPAPKPAKGKRKVKTIVSWNVYVGQTSAGVERGIRTIIKRHSPEVILLQEISGDISMLRSVGKKLGYNLLVTKRTAKGAAGREQQSTGMLVHRDVPAGALTSLRMKLSWIGPIHKVRKAGRTFVSSNLGGLQVVGLHMPTGRTTQANNPAWRESIDRLKTHGKKARDRDRDVAMVGDWNVSHQVTGTYSAHGVARAIGGEVIAAGAKVDYAVVAGRKARGFTGEKLGSDHKYFVLQLL